jgi:hypothetical protein
MDVPNHILEYRKELIELLHKSQDAFEKQLSYISAGSLALSIGFIQKVIDLKTSHGIWFLRGGWILLVITLLINCISHIHAADLHQKTIAETWDMKLYDQERIKDRYRAVSKVNWLTVGTLIAGISGIVIFVLKNI